MAKSRLVEVEHLGAIGKHPVTHLERTEMSVVRGEALQSERLNSANAQSRLCEVLENHLSGQAVMFGLARCADRA